MRYLFIFLISLITFGSMSGCGSAVPVLKPFKMDIQQGNVVTSKMLLQLKPGMTKSQVRFILGTPLIVDSFHKDRWDYYYQMRQAGKVIEQRRVILDFDKELLTKVRGDVVPQGTAGAVSGEVVGSTSTAEMLKGKGESGLLDKLQFWKEGKKPAAAPAIAEVGKTEAKTPEVKAPEKSLPEKSLLDKLKFWKKDEAAAEKSMGSKPLEAAKEVMPAPASVMTPEAPAAAEEVPSVLALPVIVPDAQVETTPVEPAKAEPPVPVPTPIKAEPIKPAPAKLVPAKPLAPVAKPAVATRPSTKPDEKKIFRLDRTLKTELLEEAPPAAPPEPVVEKPAVDSTVGEKSVKAKKKVEEAPLPAETEPGFFDRMLEKIGF